MDLISLRQWIYASIFSLVLGLLYWVDQNARNDLLQQQEITDLKDQIEVRNKIEKAVKDSPTDVDLALEWLLKRFPQ